MKRHIMIGLLSMLVLIPAAEVFSVDTPTPMLTPEQQEELGIQEPSGIIELTPCLNGFGLTCSLIVTNRTAQPQPVTIITVPSGQSAIQRNFTIGAAQIAGFSTADANCPAGTNCRLLVVYPAGQALPFDAVLVHISTSTGQPISFQTPLFVFTTTQ